MKAILKTLFFGLMICGCSYAQVVLEDAAKYYPRGDWFQKLGYRPAEMFPLRFKVSPCPLVEVNIDGKPFWLTFDFGSAGGMMVTTAIEDKIKYEFVRELKTVYPDGSPRGSGREIVLKRIEAFGKAYDRVRADLFDWKIFTSFPNDGAISLEYIENTRFTLDYKNKKLAVAEQPFPDDLLKDSDLLHAIPLLKSPEWNRYGLYLTGTVNGRDVAIYIDSGSSHTFVDRRIVNRDLIVKSRNNEIYKADVPVKIGDLDLLLSNIRVSEINRNTNYDLPVRMVIGSDLLKNFVFTVDRTKDRNLLIIHK